MDNIYDFSIVYENDMENNTLTVNGASGFCREIGGALVVDMDKANCDTVLTFWNEDGERKEARFSMESYDLTPEELAEDAAKAGYYVDPHDPCSGLFVGLYIHERLNRIWATSFLEARLGKAKAD